MARFTITHCRKLQSGLCEFDVQILSGEIHEGDSFSCQGAFQRSKFRVESIHPSHLRTTLVCDGPVAFDDELAGITLNTTVVRLPPPDLAVPLHIPTPTLEEERALKTAIEDWETRAPVQRAICLCLLRGHDTPEKIGRCLGIAAEEVRISLKCLGGVLYNHSADKLSIR